MVRAARQALRFSGAMISGADFEAVATAKAAQPIVNTVAAVRAASTIPPGPRTPLRFDGVAEVLGAGMQSGNRLPAVRLRIVAR